MPSKKHKVLVTNPAPEGMPDVVIRGGVVHGYVIVPISEGLFEVYFKDKYLGECESKKKVERLIARDGNEAPVLLKNKNGGYTMFEYKRPSNPKKKSRKKKSKKKAPRRKAAKKKTTRKKKSTKKKATKRKSTKKKTTRKKKATKRKSTKKKTTRKKKATKRKSTKKKTTRKKKSTRRRNPKANTGTKRNPKKNTGTKTNPKRRKKKVAKKAPKKPLTRGQIEQAIRSKFPW